MTVEDEEGGQGTFPCRVRGGTERDEVRCEYSGQKHLINHPRRCASIVVYRMLADILLARPPSPLAAAQQTLLRSPPDQHRMIVVLSNILHPQLQVLTPTLPLTFILTLALAFTLTLALPSSSLSPYPSPSPLISPSPSPFAHPPTCRQRCHLQKSPPV